MSEREEHIQLILLSVDSPARTSAWLASVRDWLASGAGFGSNFIELLRNSVRDGWSSRMCQAFSVHTLATLRRVIWRKETDGSLSKRVISRSSFAGWTNSGMVWHGECLTLNSSEWPSDAVACSLSQVLEAQVPSKYFLSRRACRGILRRAEKRGRELPPPLKQALQTVAMEEATR